MGRWVNQNNGTPSGGRWSQQTSASDPLDVPPKAWDELSLGGKFVAVTKEIPRTLWNFVPEPIRELSERGARGEGYTGSELAAGVTKGLGEFAKTTAQATAQGVIGLPLAGVEKVTGKEQRYTFPVLGEISSYQQQIKDMEAQGFEPGEAKALVGINAYLSLAPAAKPISRTAVGRRATQALTTKEVPTIETRAGVLDAAKGKTVEGTTRIERPAVTKIKQAFGQTPEQQKLKSRMDEHLETYYGGRDKILSPEDELNKALLSLSDAELKDYAEFTQGLKVVTEPSPNFKKAVELWRETSKSIEKDLIDRGVLTVEQVENRKWKPVETVTGRSRTELQAMGVDPIYYPYLAEESLAKSDFIPSKGKRTRGSYQKRFTGKLLAEDSYIKDPKVTIPRHQIQVFKDMMNGELVQGIIDDFAEKSKELISLFKKDPHMAEKLGYVEWKPSGTLRFFPAKTAKGSTIRGVTSKVETYWIPKEIANELNKVFKPGAIEKTLRLTYDPLMDLWRVSVLNLSPRWLFNNFMGNASLSILAKTDPLAYLKAGKETIARGLEGTKVGKKLGVKAREFPKGVLSDEYVAGEAGGKIGRLGSLPSETTQFGRPIENWINLLEQAKKYPTFRVPATITQGIIKGITALGKPGGAMNRVIENFFRSAIYISKRDGTFLGAQLDKPVPDANGIQYVNEFLHDYSKLSRNERLVFRRVLPFYNWTKFITTFAFKFPVNHPIRAKVAQTLLQEYVDYIETIDQKDDAQKSILRLKTEAIDEDGRPIYINIKSTIPFSDLFKTLPTSMKQVGTFLTSNPVSKIIIERAFKINTFTGQPFSTPPSMIEKDRFGNEINPVPSLGRHILNQAPQAGVIQKLLDAAQYGEPLKRYDTGEPKVLFGEVQTSDLLLEVLKYFGVSLSAMDVNRMKQSIDRDNLRQGVKKEVYEQQVESQLKRMKEETSFIKKAEAAELEFNKGRYNRDDNIPKSGVYTKDGEGYKVIEDKIPEGYLTPKNMKVKPYVVMARAQLNSLEGVPEEYRIPIAVASVHMGTSVGQLVKHFTAENGGDWDSKLVGRADPNDKGVTQLSPQAINTINGKDSGVNFFKNNFGEDFDIENPQHQVLGAAVFMNWLKQYGLPEAGLSNPTDSDVALAYNMGAKGYVDAVKGKGDKKRLKRYRDLLERNDYSISKK